MLKVGSPQPQAEQIPQFGQEQQMQGMPQQDTEQYGDVQQFDGGIGQDGIDSNSEFDTNFDAGVDADEDNDPKRYIQQLTGKLSQSLRKYNESLPKPESDLCKYVAGMILKQATEGLSNEDKKEIVDKMTDNGDNSDNEDGDGMNSNDENGNLQVTESKYSHVINELFQEILNSKFDDDEPISDKPIKDVGFKRKPFTAPKMR